MKTLSESPTAHPYRFMWLGAVIIGLGLLMLTAMAAVIFSLWPRPLTVMVVTSTPTVRAAQALATATPLPTKTATPLPLWGSLRIRVKIGN